MVDLAKELAKAREETKAIVLRENDDLKAENRRLQMRDEELQKQDEEIRKQAEELQKKNDKLEQEMNKLRHELRQDSNEMKRVLHQKDQNSTLQLIKHSIRQDDLGLELKKMMKKEIENYLQVNKICVSGRVRRYINSGGTESYEVKFGHTFARPPTFSAAINGFGINANPARSEVDGPIDVKEVNNSSAKIVLYRGTSFWFLRFAWIACL